VHEVELLGRDVVTGDVVSLDLDSGIELVDAQLMSMSVARTRPRAPTWWANQLAAVTPPVPTSQHRRP
jgi:hypothetical protein